MRTFIVLSAFLDAALCQQGPWAQCRGIGFTGVTTCITGYTCVYQNDWYSQCVSGSASTTVTTTFSTKLSSTTGSAIPTNTATGKFMWFGVDESCAEWGTAIPGTLGVDYTWPSTATIQVSISLCLIIPQCLQVASQRCTTGC